MIVALLVRVAGPDGGAGRIIHLSRDDQARLAAEFATAAGRPPTAAERAALVGRWVREEVFYREALRRGLGKGDPPARGRLAREMEALAASPVDIEAPADAVLEQWRQRHPERFAQDLTLSFDQVYFADRSRAVVGNALIAGGADWARVGDPIALPASFDQESRAAIAAELGEKFARHVGARASKGGWHGPVESTRGWHLVRLTERRPGVVPPLAAIRAQVEADWRAENQRRQQDAAYRALRETYSVRIDR